MTPSTLSEIRKHLSFERLFFILVLLTFAIRLISLDLKLFHHDEAIHAWFSYDLLTKGGYSYDPMYHGPLLYYLTSGMFWLFGDTDLVARFLPAVFGSALVLLVYPIYRMGYLDRKQTLVAALFIAVSPDLVYFSRFLRHDIFQLFFTLLILVALLAYLNYGKLRYGILAGIAVAGGMTLKEDMPIFLLIFITFGLYLILRKKITLPREWKRDAAVGILVALGLIILLYSSFGYHWEVLVPDATHTLNQTGWYKAVDHWTAMHNMCRICGPWFFYIILFLLYEVPIIVLAFLGIGQFFATDCKVRAWTRNISSSISHGLPRDRIDELTKVSLYQLRHRGEDHKKRDFFIFCLFWMAISMAAYAYIGEKVPWLIIHQLLPMIFVGMYKMTSRKAAIAVAASAFLIVMTWHVAFVPADISEPIVQVQNSEDMRTVMKLMDASNRVMVASKDYWPLPWYYRGSRWDKIDFYGGIVDQTTISSKDADMIFTHDTESYPSIEGYEKKTYRLAYWFSYYDNENRIPEWYLLRDGKLGSINIDVFTKPGLYERAGLTVPAFGEFSQEQSYQVPFTAAVS
ncbi:MAG: TIGR03663 family protein [Methanoregulaceae archaeon]|nr:TIGR03663 family protein [Methanoregulaceae archaeon]